MFNSPARFLPVRDSTRPVARNLWNTRRSIPFCFAPLLSLLVSLAFLLLAAACVRTTGLTASISEFNGRVELTSAREPAGSLPADCDAFRCLAIVPSPTTWVASTDTLSFDWNKFVMTAVSDDDPPETVVCNFCNLTQECSSGPSTFAFAGGVSPTVRLLDTLTNTDVITPFDFIAGCEANTSPRKRSVIQPINPPPGSSSLQLEPILTGVAGPRTSLFNFETVSPSMPRIWYAHYSLDDRGLKDIGDPGSTTSVRHFTWNMCGDSQKSACSPWPANFSSKLEVVSIRVLQGQPISGDPESLDPRTASPIRVYSIDSRDARARCFPDFNQLDADRLPPFEVNFSTCRNAFPVPQADGTCTTANDLSIWRLTPGYQPGDEKRAIAWEVHFAEDGRCGAPMPDLARGPLWLEFTIRVIP